MLRFAQHDSTVTLSEAKGLVLDFATEITVTIHRILRFAQGDGLLPGPES
jgi:hypothetical protein